MDGKFLEYLEVKKLEKMPTKLELIATIARLINQVRAQLLAGGRWRAATAGAGASACVASIV